MNLQQLLDNITPDIYQNLKRAVELGKWPDGNPISAEQRQLCMQAMIAYETKHFPPEQRTGYIPPKDSACSTDPVPPEQPLKWQ